MKGSAIELIEAGLESDEDGLDREHQERFSEVAQCDTSDGRDSAARSDRGLLTEEIQYLLGERTAQGSDEHVDAIRRSGWFPYQREIGLAARLAWLLDMLFWTALWTSIWWRWMRVLTHV